MTGSLKKKKKNSFFKYLGIAFLFFLVALNAWFFLSDPKPLREVQNYNGKILEAKEELEDKKTDFNATNIKEIKGEVERLTKENQTKKQEIATLKKVAEVAKAEKEKMIALNESLRVNLGEEDLNLLLKTYNDNYEKIPKEGNLASQRAIFEKKAGETNEKN